MFDFKMPSMGADMEDGTLVAWNFAVGDHVKKGDIICEIETAKGNIDVEIWESGTLTEILVAPGAKVPVGALLARLETTAGTEPRAPEPEPHAPPPESEAPEAPPPAPAPARKPGRAEQPTVALPASRPGAAARPPASPAARKRALELGIDLDDIVGSGPGGAVTLDDLERPVPVGHHRVTPVARKMAEAEGVDLQAVDASGPHDTVTKADVEQAVQARTKAPAAASGDSALREAIAKAMAKSKREIPHYYLKMTVDVSTALSWMADQNEQRGIADRLVFGALVARAVALAARDVPEMNGFYADGRFAAADRVHLGFAVAMRGGGVVAPAIHDLAHKSLDETMAAIKDVVKRVRGGKLRSSEMTDPTITLTSLGDMGVDTVFGVIYPPQVAIVGFGSPREVPFAVNGHIGVHTCADVTLSGDHRVSDGLTGARFLQQIRNYLSQPEAL